MLSVALVAVTQVIAQPRYGPVTLIVPDAGHTIHSPRISDSYVFWVDETAESSTAMAASLSDEGLVLDALPIAQCAAPDRLVIEATHASGGLLSLRHDDSFDLFLVSIDESSGVDSVPVVSETAGFEEGFGVLPNYPEEASITSIWDGWAITWATARLTPTLHEWMSTAYLSFFSQWSDSVPMPYGDAIPTELFSSPRAHWRGSDTLTLYATSTAGDSLSYAAYSYVGDELHEVWPALDCGLYVCDAMWHSPGDLLAKFLDVESETQVQYQVWGREVQPECVFLGELEVPHSFDRTAARWGWGFAGVTATPNEIWIESVDDLGGAVPRVAALHTSTNGAVHREADIVFNNSGYVEVVWTESPDEGSQANVLKWASVHAWDNLATKPVHSIPTQFSLAAYPNPFNSSVQIEYVLPRASDVRVGVFNTLGQEVATLINERVVAGSHSLNWSPTGASGVYLVRLAADELVTSKKILYVR